MKHHVPKVTTMYECPLCEEEYDNKKKCRECIAKHDAIIAKRPKRGAIIHIPTHITGLAYEEEFRVIAIRLTGRLGYDILAERLCGENARHREWYGFDDGDPHWSAVR